MASEWHDAPLGDLVDLVSGGTPSKETPSFWTGTIPWVSAKDMKRFQVFDTEDHISKTSLGNGGKLVPANTVLLLTRGMTLLNDVPICITRQAMAFNQDVKAVIPRPGVVADFLPYLLLASKRRLINLVDLAGHGTGRLNTDELRTLRVTVPPLSDQHAIAQVLGNLDAKIELNRRMNETLEGMATALFRSWFVDFDPVRANAGSHSTGVRSRGAQLFPDSFEDSVLGRVPRGWRVRRVDEVATIVGGGTPSTSVERFWEGGRHHWATPKDLAGIEVPVLVDTSRRITDEGLTQTASGLLPVGTVLLSSRAPIGYLAICEVPSAINQGFIAMIPHEGVTNLFLLLWAKSAHEQILSRANGSTFLEISKSNFRPMLIAVPPESVLSAFERLIRPEYLRIVANTRETLTLRNLRDSLLPMLVSGDLRIG